MTNIRQIALFLCAIVPVVFTLPSPRRDIIPGKYIVTLKDGSNVDVSDHLNWVNGIHRRSLNARNTAGVQHTYGISDWHAYAGEFDESTVEAIRNSPDVATVEEDIQMHLFDAPTEYKRALTTQNDATYGLGTIANRQQGFFNYTYDTFAGAGTFAYVVDSGIRRTHEEFGGRAVFGYTGYPGAETDTIGHGTHVAATIGGARFGVSKQTNIIDVKVFEGPSAELSTILAGYDWAVNDIVSKGRATRSAINLSLGGITFEPITSWNAAIDAAYSLGVLTVAASGNFGIPATFIMPANVPNAITVGAMDEQWQRASFSNFGPGVDIHAPGVQVESAGIESDTASIKFDGTSMATPHVVGVALYLQELEGLDTPQAVTDRIITLSTKDAMSGPLEASPNRILYNGNAA